MANKHSAELNMQTVPSLNITYTEVISPESLVRLGRHNCYLLYLEADNLPTEESSLETHLCCAWFATSNCNLNEVLLLPLYLHDA